MMLTLIFQRKRSFGPICWLCHSCRSDRIVLLVFPGKPRTTSHSAWLASPALSQRSVVSKLSNTHAPNSVLYQNSSTPIPYDGRLDPSPFALLPPTPPILFCAFATREAASMTCWLAFDAFRPRWI